MKQEADGRIHLINPVDLVDEFEDVGDLLRDHLHVLAVFDSDRVSQIWIAVHEALQNAFRHGSCAGERIEIWWIHIASSSRLCVRVRQPKGWPIWKDRLGPDRLRRIMEGAPEPGGTVLILLYADEVEVTPYEQGCDCVLHFKPVLRIRPAMQLIDPNDSSSEWNR